MKIGVSSYSFSKYRRATGASLIEICDLAKKIGFDGIEFIDLDGEDQIAQANEIREHCAKIGLEINAYTIGANFLAEDVEAEKARLKGCLAVAKALGAKVMRHDVIYKLKDEDPRYTWREAIAEIAPHVREITEYAATLGIRTCTENHGRSVQAPERVEALMMAVNHPNYGWLFDMGNFQGVGADPLAAYNIARPYIFHVHAKDNIVKDGSIVAPAGMGRTSQGNFLRGTIIGQGCVPIVPIVAALQASGYDGYLSYEFEGSEENLPAIEAGYEYLRRVVDATKP